MKPGSPSAGYHTRLLYRGIHRDMMRATFQMRPYRGRIHQSGRRWNTANTSATCASVGPNTPVAQEDSGFHPALAYKYSGERGACKVSSWVKSKRVEAPRHSKEQ